jgi:opacity protein-like surface antigen
MKFNALIIRYSIFVCILFHLQTICFSQENSTGPFIGGFIGKMNYQGDLNPNSFTFARSKFTGAITFRQPLSRWFSLRGAVAIGKLEAADRYNRDYLKPRNLSFYSSIKEATLGLEVAILDLSTNRFSPYIYASISAFHFNPYTYDNSGAKIFLQPLSTEGQGLSQFTKQKSYKLTQAALGFGIGARYAVTENVNIGIEFSQRKTFTDYLDDVSSIYIDPAILLQAKGAKAVELAYRGDELPGGQPYPGHGEQRGTPSEMDWYYFFGLTFEIRLSAFGNIFKSGKAEHFNALHYTRCPKY